MEISTFAEQILFGNTLADKLLKLDHFEDSHPGKPLKTPQQPGRPSALSLDSWHGRNKVLFSDVRRFNSEKDRGLVIHFFANHELLALELMALALLKFPHAPQKFRRGLVRTLMDEQEHVKLYLHRMQDIGIEFGEIPVSNFFWQTIAPMKTPLDFVTRLSLTLEQANLDYATHYAKIYQNLGDLTTARILERIYKDEIGHVKHGLHWFRKWHESNVSDWKAYRNLLAEPLTPSRAKGIGFNFNGRSQAGLSEDFIAELEIYTHSKGRCPAVHVFDPSCELQIAHEGKPFTSKKTIQALGSDLETLPFFLCAHDDVVLVKKRPSLTFLQSLHRAGFTIPELATYTDLKGLKNTPLTQRKISVLKPWGWSPVTANLLSPLQANLSSRNPQAGKPLWQTENRKFYSKSWSAAALQSFLTTDPQHSNQLCTPTVIGNPCSTPEAVKKEIDRIREENYDDVVVKADFGAAGQNQVHLFKDTKMTSAKLERVKTLLEIHDTVVVEPWLKKVCDVSAQVEIEGSEKIRVLGWTRFSTDSRGRYQGSYPSQPMNGLGIELRRFIYGQGKDQHWLKSLFRELSIFLSRKMESYKGPAGIDALIYTSPEGLRLKPLVELNPRFTMGRVALHLGKKIHKQAPSMWITISQRNMKANGFDSFKEFSDSIKKQHPIQSRNGQLTEGALFTTDPEEAQMFTTLLMVGKSIPRILSMIAR